MIDKWFSTIKLPISPELFHQLPQNRAYKYEYYADAAWLTPRPKTCHATLDLRSFAPPFETRPPKDLAIRPLADADWEALPPVFASAFHRVQPFASLDEDRAVEAARDCLQYTQSGGDGPLVPDACFVAVGGDDALRAGLLITLIPKPDRESFLSWTWRRPPPKKVGPHNARPHLTWIFVSPWYAHGGAGTALLDAAIQALSRLGYEELTSTFLIGNESSMLWHWRAGFRLLRNPWSQRARESER